MSSSLRILYVALLAASFGVKVFLASSDKLPLNCKFHGHSNYACVAIGLENHDETVLFSEKIVGDHVANKTDESVVELVVKGQNVSFVPVNVGNLLPKLKRYEVQNSSLVAIKRQNFNNLHLLRTLILSYNYIESLNQDVFQDLIYLTHLRLSGNRLTQIHFSTFSNNVKLEIVILDNNKLSIIHEQQFMNLCNLKQIYLHNNLIEDLRDRTFINNEKLETIDLRNNRIKTVGSQLLVGLKFLKTFDFFNNQCIEGDYKTVEELTDIFHNFCFPPYLEEYKNEIEDLKKTLNTVNETLSDCETQLEEKSSLSDNLQSQVDKLTDEKALAESESETCANLKETVESSLETCQTEREEKEKIIAEVATNLTQCELKHESFIDDWLFMNKTVAKIKKDIEDCDLKHHTLKSTIKLNERRSDSNEDIDMENNKTKMRLQIEELTKQLKTTDNEMKSLTEENIRLKLRNEEFQAQLSTCMTQLPMCNSFYIQCSFRHVSNVEDYVCTAKHVSACQPSMKLIVGGTHLALRSNNDVNVIEIKDSIFHFTEDLIKELPHLYKIKVQNGGLSTLEPKLESFYLKNIELIENRFVEVPSNIFSRVNQLESLVLNKNDIEMLHRDSFTGLNKLLHLSLRDNKISVLPQGVFDDLTNLEQLSMKNNQLKVLNSDLLKFNTKLNILKFDDNQNLRKIGLRLLDHSKRFTMVQFARTCARTRDDDSVEIVKRNIELYCSK